MKPLTDARKLREVLLEEKRITEQIVGLLKQDHDKVYDTMVEVHLPIFLFFYFFIFFSLIKVCYVLG